MPPDPAFVNEPYYVGGDGVWNETLRVFANDMSISAQIRYNVLMSYYIALIGRPGEDARKKLISINNRIQDILKESVTGPTHTFTRAGAVVIFSDGLALYTGIPKNPQNPFSNLDFGFPKGEIEYDMYHGNDVSSSFQEPAHKAALRELREEAGFTLSVDLPSEPTDAFQAHNALLQRRESGDYSGPILPSSYTVIGYNRHTVGSNYYLLLYLSEPSTAAGPDLTNMTPNAQSEGITVLRILPQGGPYKFNKFSSLTFPYRSSGGKRRKTRRAKSVRSRG